MNNTSTLEFALAGLIGKRAQTGYDLRKVFATTAMSHYSDSPGSIYPALRRMEARGWIATGPMREDQAEDPRRRQIFHLTEAGRTALTAWIEQPVTREDTSRRIEELMLRFSFMDGNVPRSTAIRFLEEFERGLGSYLQELRNSWEMMRSAFPLNTGLLAFQAGIESMEAQLLWARRARAQLTAAGSQQPQ